MAKIIRKLAKIFGSTSGLNQIAEFGSLAAGSPAFTIDPDVIQALPNYLGGWFQAVIGANSPAIEDMNALCYLYAYQIAYLMQQGVAEYNTATPYFIGSIVNSGGQLYASLTDNNTGNPLSSATNWISVGSFNVVSFSNDSTWIAPSGVTQVQVIAQRTRTPLAYGTTIMAVCASGHDSGSLFSWGLNDVGTLGINVSPGVTLAISSPQIVAAPFQASGLIPVQVKLSDQSNTSTGYALTKNGSVYAWGANGSGQIGDGTVIDKSSPVFVSTPFSARRLSVNNSARNCLALTSGGLLYSWGRNDSGSLGVGDILSRSTPTLVLGGHLFKNLTEGLNLYTLAVDTAGAAWAWGDNASGNLGVGDVISRSSPVSVLGGHVFSKIVSCNRSTIGLDTNGALWGWGDNSSGQLGVGDLIARSSPVAVLGGLLFSDVATTSESVFATTTGGVLYSWGNNTEGQLGLGDIISRRSPVQVIGGHTFTKVIVPELNRSVYAIDATGALYAWGGNTVGQLGVGDVLSRSSPVAVLGGLSFFDARSRGAMVLGVSTNGRIYSWGLNDSGQLGLGDVNSRSSPVAVLGVPILNIESEVITKVIAVVPGQSYAVSLSSFFAQFGSVNLLAGGADKITLKW